MYIRITDIAYNTRIIHTYNDTYIHGYRKFIYLFSLIGKGTCRFVERAPKETARDRKTKETKKKQKKF